MSPRPDRARSAAAAAMTAVTEGRRLLAETLPGLVEALPPADRARAGRLATEALRWAPRSDRLLGPFLKKRPEDSVLNLLRLALYEMNEGGTPPHAAVASAVAIAPGPVRGLVNAVLRNVLREGRTWRDLPLPAMPKWLRKPLVEAWGPDTVAELERVHAAAPPLDLTPRDPAADLGHLGARRLPTGSWRLDTPGQVSRLPGFEEGEWWVQDAAAAIPARVLGARPGERVLDLCAAPGGKTMQLAAAGAAVTSLDISEPRMRVLRENLARTGLDARIVVADALEWMPESPFDAILLDAPCSATGTLRRHPDLVFAKSAEDIAPLPALQSALIDRALGMLAPGGRLVFATCSLLPGEGEDLLAAALARHPGLLLDEPGDDWIDPRWRSPGGGLRIRPDHWADRGGLDGFFVARLRKPA